MNSSPEVEELERRLAAFKPLNTRDVAWWYGQLNGAKAVAEDAISRLRASTTTTAEAWRPIESAPKDYERVWCHPCRCVGYRVTRGDVHRWVDENRQIIRPSHWMPLPPAPHVARTEKAKFCHHGDGCSESWHVGGNYGSPVCKNPAHHVAPPEETAK